MYISGILLYNLIRSLLPICFLSPYLKSSHSFILWIKFICFEDPSSEDESYTGSNSTEVEATNSTANENISQAPDPDIHIDTKANLGRTFDNDEVVVQVLNLYILNPKLCFNKFSFALIKSYGSCFFPSAVEKKCGDIHVCKL